MQIEIILHLQDVGSHLGQGLVAGDRCYTQYFKLFRMGQSREDGHDIIMAGITINNDFTHYCSSTLPLLMRR